MADNIDASVDEGQGRAMANTHAPRMMLLLASVQQVIYAAVPFCMVMVLLASSGNRNLQNFLRPAVPLATLPPLAAVWVKYKKRSVAENKGAWPCPTLLEACSLLLALLLLAFSTVCWVREFNGQKVGDTFSVYPAAFATVFLLFSLSDLCYTASAFFFE